MNHKILICGTPTVGKSTMAKALSKHLDIPWISTDQIRMIMRTVARKEDYPKLFNKYDTAETFLGAYSAEEIADLELAQGEEVWVAVKAFIENDFTWRNSYIIEGVNLLPKLIRQDFKDNPKIKPIVLIDRDLERMRKVVYERGLWDDADTYSDSVKEKEVEWAQKFSIQLEKQAVRFDVPIIEVTKNIEVDLQNALIAVTEPIG